LSTLSSSLSERIAAERGEVLAEHAVFVEGVVHDRQALEQPLARAAVNN
jgi:hypothetical protein